MATSYHGQAKGAEPSYGSLYGFDHVHFWVGNAKQAADWYVVRFGFVRVAYRGLETGSRNVVTHVVKQGQIVFAFSSPLSPAPAAELGDDMNAHLAKHGDGVKDVAFTVADVRSIFDSAVERGAVVIQAPTESTDEHGTVVVATIKTYGDTLHSFVERRGYKGAFLPGYVAVDGAADPLTRITAPIGLDYVDHVVGNMPDAGMIPTVEWYERTLQFHRFWSVDDKQIHTEYSALRSVVMADFSERVKMPINEPAKGLRKSQIQEYVEFYGGSGVQHIALNTRNIIHAISAMRERGAEFLSVPPSYYDDLRARLSRSPIKVTADLEEIQRLNILVDFDDRGFLLQLFSKNTVFLEIIQREGCEGFGAGNFGALFRSLEMEQAKRGNLTAE